MLLDWDYMLSKLPLIIDAIPRTLLLVLESAAIGFIIGFLLSIVRSYKIPVLSQLATAYISIFRGVPLLVQMYLVYFGLPDIFAHLNESFAVTFFPTEFNKMFIALLIFSLYTAAYQAEVWYSALRAVDYNQMEAALSVGMTLPQALIRIFIPQALVSAIPNFANLFISLFKQTSLAFTIKVIDIMAVAKMEAGSTYRYLEMYVLIAIVYWILILAFEQLFVYLEKYFSNQKKHRAVSRG
ncbi:L-cystine transport system permease protein [Paenibacillus sp. 1_12]|uniref:amino acid ABC transporter permease n=1 Tax=Paenibacillus sp. 1_12 TaxID=1566278 RepID=UPI0008E4D725|nr:amino acid ABC transporter permease [Paenibacillus sp. 1_12]SFL00529.1 L-cystine transport system permease protein [Paenibacillus sp. 1_12]